VVAQQPASPNLQVDKGGLVGSRYSEQRFRTRRLDRAKTKQNICRVVAQNGEKNWGIKWDICFSQSRWNFSTSYISTELFIMCLLCEGTIPTSHPFGHHSLPQASTTMQPLQPSDSSQVHPCDVAVRQSRKTRWKQEYALRNVGAWMLPATPQNSEERRELGARPNRCFNV
jgi:hypothetical protein